MFAEFALTTEWTSTEQSPLLLAVLVLAGAGTATLFVLGLTAYWRRRTRAYCLVAVALGLLLARTLVGFGTVHGAVPMYLHHLIEHTADFLIALLLLVAIYLQRTDPPSATTERSDSRADREDP